MKFPRTHHPRTTHQFDRLGRSDEIGTAANIEEDEDTAAEIRIEAQSLFLGSVARGFSVTAAVATAGILSKTTVYRWRKSDPAFAAAWAEAQDAGIDKLEDEARRRAYDGVVEPVYQGGIQVGSITKYSDNLLMFLLKAHRPRKYRERTAVELSRGEPLEEDANGVDEVLEALEKFVRDPRAHIKHQPSPTNDHEENREIHEETVRHQEATRRREEEP